LQIYGVEPAEANVLNGGKPGELWHSLKELLPPLCMVLISFILLTEPNCRTTPHHWKWSRV